MELEEYNYLKFLIVKLIQDRQPKANDDDIDIILTRIMSLISERSL